MRLLAGARGLSAGSATAGGNLAITSAVGAIAAAVRPRTILEAAGAQRVELSSVVDYVQPEWTSGAGAWLGEGADAPEASTLAVGTGNATPKTAGAVVDISRRMMKQSEAIESQVAAEMARLVRGVVEDGAFNGTGSLNQPLGLLATPGATAVSFAGAVPTYAELVSMAEAYYDNDADPLAGAWFLNPATFAALLEVERVSASGRYAATIEAGVPYVMGLRAWPTAYMPAGKVILCDPGNVTLTYWRAATLLRNPFVLGTTGAVRLTVLNDVDLVVTHRPQLIIGG